MEFVCILFLASCIFITMHYFWNTITQPLLDALQPRSIVEIGMEHGKQTQQFLEYAHGKNIIVHGIDPLVQFPLEEWKNRYGDTFVFHQGISLEQLPRIEQYDAVIIDGDHNWYTVFHELKLIEAHANPFPLIILHDTAWPYARRDLYYDLQRIPATFRQPSAKGGVIPGSSQLQATGSNVQYEHAQNEGGEKNGVLTAVEDFVAQTSLPLSFTQLPGLHGIGILLDARHPRVTAITDVLQQLRPSPLLQRHLERVEEERLMDVMQRKKLEKGFVDLQKEFFDLLKENHRLACELMHMQGTRSWRWTAALRQAGLLTHKKQHTPRVP